MADMHAFHALHASHFQAAPVTPTAPTVPANLPPKKTRPNPTMPFLVGFMLTQRRLVFRDELPVLGPPAPEPHHVLHAHPSPAAAAAEALDALYDEP
jgi:hypothetical protein